MPRRRSGGGGVILLALIVAPFAMCSREKQPATATHVERTSVAKVAVMPSAERAREVAYVSVASLNVRESPEGRKSKALPGGAMVYVHESDGKWVRISNANSPPEWVAKDFLCYKPGCYKAPVAAVGSGSSRPSQARATAAQSSRLRSNYAAPAVRPGGGYSSQCPCSGSDVCIGPRGGVFCITSGGNKRYLPRR
jgi:hypothetical protein